MSIKKNDFVEVEYTGKTKEEDIIFDTTNEEVAKKNNIHSEQMIYGPIIICVGEGQLLKGLDHQLEGKDVGEYTFDIPTEEAFGKKNPKLIQLIPISKFKEQNIKPEPGMRLNIDGVIGVIKTASGGRILVDFNHPLANQDLIYDIAVKRIVTDKKEQIESLLNILLSVKKEESEIELSENEAKIKIKRKGLPKEVLDKMAEEIKKLVQGVSKVVITPLE